MQQHIIGQPTLVDRMLVCLLADGHLLVEGAPGLAKTKAINALAQRLEGEFKRIQFTPDLLPGDITGTDIYRPQTQTFDFQAGPIFHHLILADEINRAPAKVQSALLEAMAERQITVGGQTRALPELFMVMATQNPIEQEGTYPLPEAQLDRFLMQVLIDYPDADAELKILRLVRGEALQQEVSDVPTLRQQDVFNARKDILQLHFSAAVEQYVVQLILATRQPQAYGDDLSQWLEYGASPRGTIALERCARAHAWLHGKDYVSPDDVQAVVHDVLRHRLILSFEAQASGVGVDAVIDELIKRVPVS
ncbi:AAA family ATPase [Bacterioplanes sanyensis]|uniref:AAA family ATPase n=2 Tax=Bacterioplanes sanyensis TaxID=1249553 RepID=A0A222FRT7_9GAMM|nr:AAA family ATPase [Bacterioplanes sanyensis]